LITGQLALAQPLFVPVQTHLSAGETISGLLQLQMQIAMAHQNHSLKLLQLLHLAPAPARAPAPAPVVTTSKVTLLADALFDFDKSVIKPEGAAKLNDLSSKVKRCNS
jgi:outer membrane protein OmpA-like peptidoglycan-associated protein